MLPPSWKTEIEETVEKAAHAADKKSSEIAAEIRAFNGAIQAQHDRPEKPDEIKRALDIATVILLFATALFTGLAWWVFRDQLREMKSSSEQIERSIKVSNRIANETKTANDLTGEANRPWIGAVGPVTVPANIFEGKPFSITIAFTNAGKSPALITNIKCRAGILEASPTSPTYALTPAQIAVGSQIFIVPGQQTSCPLKQDAITPTDLARLKMSSGSIAYYAFAELLYTDIKTKLPHTTHVCFVFRPGVDGWVGCPTYNSAD